MEPITMLDFAPSGVLTPLSPPLAPTWVCYFGAESVSIWGRSHQVDLDRKKLSIEWQVSCGSPSGEEPENPPREDVADAVPWGHADYAVDVYLTDGTGKVFSYDPTKLLGPGRFEIQHELHALEHFPAPFDSYTFHVSAHAINPATNESVDIAQFSSPDPPNGFTVYSTNAEGAKRFTYNTDDGPSITEVQVHALTVTIQYSNLTVALTGCMFAANWVLTLTSLYIAASVVAKSRATWSAFMLHSTMILVVPFIRGLYLCPPPIGVFLDTTSFFSQIIILVFCSVIILRAIIVPPKGDKGSPHDLQKAM